MAASLLRSLRGCVASNSSSALVLSSMRPVSVRPPTVWGGFGVGASFAVDPKPRSAFPSQTTSRTSTRICRDCRFPVKQRRRPRLPCPSWVSVVVIVGCHRTRSRCPRRRVVRWCVSSTRRCPSTRGCSIRSVWCVLRRSRWLRAPTPYWSSGVQVRRVRRRGSGARQ